MNVKIYEERTGLMIFPTITGKEPDKDENIINLFNNHIDLYIEKKIKELRISCHISIQQGEERKGYYIKSISKYEDDSFTEFKKESNKVLNTLNIQRAPEDINNVMLDNIEKLDLDIYLHDDTEIIAHILESGEYLEYQAGNIEEITILCKDILKKINNSKIAISSEPCKLGDINILKTRKSAEPLYPNERTRALLEKHKKELIEKKKKEGENLAKDKIVDGTNLIKEGLTILRSSGYEPNEISSEIDKIYDEISTSNKIKLKEKKLKDKGTAKDKGQAKDKGNEQKGNRTYGVEISSNSNIIIIIIILILGAIFLSSIILGFPINLNKDRTAEQNTNTEPAVTLPPIKSNVNIGNADINNNVNVEYIKSINDVNVKKIRS